MTRKQVLEWCEISIHALLAESDPCPFCGNTEVVYISIHALLAESDMTILIYASSITYFYPRSPCGERRRNTPDDFCSRGISIHALLAESDKIRRDGTRAYDISIHALLAESDWPGLLARPFFLISIHALLAESDSKSAQNSGALLRI